MRKNSEFRKILEKSFWASVTTSRHWLCIMYYHCFIPISSYKMFIFWLLTKWQNCLYQILLLLYHIYNICMYHYHVSWIVWHIYLYSLGYILMGKLSKVNKELNWIALSTRNDLFLNKVWVVYEVTDIKRHYIYEAIKHNLTS